MENWELLFFFFGVAALYSSVGFGGGSSYKAILALYTFEQIVVRSIGLICNITVVLGGTYLFYKHGHLKWKKVWPLVIFSIPAAYFGGTVQMLERTYFILLAVVLILAALIMIWQTKTNKIKEKDILIKEKKGSIWLDAGLGTGIGFLAGVVGIGGGIFLAPILHLIHWAESKIISATASAFILVNSIAGLIGQQTNPDFYIDWRLAVYLIVAVFLGGQIGSRLGAKQLSEITIKKWTALLIMFVGIRILIKYV